MPGHRIFDTSFASIYPHYVAKAERKDHSKEEVDRVICWLTGYDDAGLERVIADEVDLETFFAQAPEMNPNASLITGVICGIRVQEIEDPLMQKIRYMDLLVDEVAQGKEDDVDPARQHCRRLTARRPARALASEPAAQAAPWPTASSPRSLLNPGAVGGVVGVELSWSGGSAQYWASACSVEVVPGQAPVGVVVAGDRCDQLQQALLVRGGGSCSARSSSEPFQVPVVAAGVQVPHHVPAQLVRGRAHLGPQSPLVNHAVVPLAQQGGVVDVGGPPSAQCRT